MNENPLTILEEYEIIKPLIHKMDSIIDNCIGDCQNKYFHTFEYKYVYDVKLTSISDNEIVNLTIAHKEMILYGLIEN